MPALRPNPLDTAPPAHARRRVWKHPELTSHSLAVLSFDRLHLAPLAGVPKPETVAAAEQGADPDALLGPLATAVELIGVRRVRLDLLANALAVEYVGGGLGTSRLTLTFADPETADACFTKLWRRLGEGCKLLPPKRDTWALARAPLILLGATLTATLVLALVLSVFEDLALARSAAAVSVPAAGKLGTPVGLPKSPLEVLLGWLDWRAVCVAGGAAAAASQVWLYRRLTRPPTRLELVRA